MTLEQILNDIALGQSLIANAMQAYTAIKGTLDAQTQAQVEAAVRSSGADLDASTAQLAQDAA